MKIISTAFKALGTLNTIEIPDTANGNGLELVETAKSMVMKLDDQLSVFKPDSEISKINMNAGKAAIEVSETTLTLIKDSIRFAQESNGLFDITSRPLSALWGIGKKGDFIPDQQAIDHARSLVDYQTIEINENRVKLGKEGQCLDLGGIAKGFAVDLVRNYLIDNGVITCVLDFGGSVSIIGEERTIGIQNPFAEHGKAMGKISIKDKCLVTSGTYEKFMVHEGKRYSHIIDPTTGIPVDTGITSVTLIGDNAETLDAICTSFILLGPRQGLMLARKYACQCILVFDTGNVQVDQGLEFTLINEKK